MYCERSCRLEGATQNRPPNRQKVNTEPSASCVICRGKKFFMAMEVQSFWRPLMQSMGVLSQTPPAHMRLLSPRGRAFDSTTSSRLGHTRSLSSGCPLCWITFITDHSARATPHRVKPPPIGPQTPGQAPPGGENRRPQPTPSAH